MTSLLEMKTKREAALTKADSIITAAENNRRALTPSEATAVDHATAEARELGGQIATAERRTALHAVSAFDAPAPAARPTRKFSASYAKDFYAWLRSGCSAVGAALYEGSAAAGGYTVPVTVSGQVVPLAPADSVIRRLATVIETENDVRFPVKTSFGSAAAKAESGASPSSFSEGDPALASVLLSAFMAGCINKISWELLQDVPSFAAFLSQDVALDLLTLEENLFLNGSGSGQAQGMLGNVGAGVLEEPDSTGNLVTLNGLLDLIGSLKSVYHANATFLMERATSIALRKAQTQANLFAPVFTRENGRDMLHGYPVEYSAAMPLAARGACPVLFGDFSLGYLIGDRGGLGVNITVLDQALASVGVTEVLTYRRTDGRVRRAEALQGYNIAAS